MSDRVSGCLFGLALGDALAATVEFVRDVRAIEARLGPRGSRAEPLGDPARVTDDTQMALALGDALVECSGPPWTAERVEPPLRRAFVDWMDSPENTRAPGNTCMSACRRLKQGLPWVEATVLTSKGCGANMRVAPVGLLGGENSATRAGLAQFQAALTHGHPTALAASDLTAVAVAALAAGEEPINLPARLRAYAESQRHAYHQGWLGNLWREGGDDPSPEEFVARGWSDCLVTLARLEAALENDDRDSDPCLYTGEGWVAEEALGTGLLCFLLFPDEPVAALRRAAVTSGDSDSIACLAGAFAGARHGIDAWPADWLARIEYRDRLTRLAGFLKG